VGEGLGIQIVRTLVEGELSGKIEWQSTAGTSTEVTVVVPLQYLDEQPMTAAIPLV
jgi:nitrogen-specific signal transduction histidine kinase